MAIPSRSGASTLSWGLSAATATSKRTWSLPLPVEPCPTQVAPSRAAASTSNWAIRGRPSAVARHRSEHLRPAGAVDPGRQRAGRAWRGGQYRDPLSAPDRQGKVAEQPAQLLLPASRRGSAQAVFGLDVMTLRPGDPHQTELRDIARNGRLRGQDSGAMQPLDELFLGRDLVFGDDRQDRLLTLTL